MLVCIVFKAADLCCVVEMQANAKGMKEFQSGRKTAAIISGAASTGFSLHDDKYALLSTLLSEIITEQLDPMPMPCCCCFDPAGICV